MSYFALSLHPQTHDLHLDGEGSLVTVLDAAAVSQHVKQHLKFWEGEWFLDTTAGVPWIRFVFVKPFDRPVAEAVVKDALLSVPGVTEILSFDTTFHPERRYFEVHGVQLQTEFDEVVTINA